MENKQGSTFVLKDHKNTCEDKIKKKAFLVKKKVTVKNL